MAASVAGFAFCRVLLGLGEAAIFPGSVRSIAEWFPQRERAFATGLFNAGTNIGALATPIIVPIITLRYGWYWAFFGTGTVGFLWLAVWLWQYRTPRTHPGVNAAELALIESDPPDGAAFKVPGLALAGIVAAVCFVSGMVAATFFGSRLFAVALFSTGLITAIVLNPRRQVWAYAVGKFMTDPVWWLYLTWLPDFLVKAHHVDIRSAMLPLATIYLMADIGSVLGGYVSSKLIDRGYSSTTPASSRWAFCRQRDADRVCRAGGQPVGRGALVSIAASGHQAWSANLYTLVSDMFPRRAVGSVIGFGAMMGACGGAMMQIAVGIWLDASNNNYVPIFVAAGTLYIIALGVIHLLVPKMTPAIWRCRPRHRRNGMSRTDVVRAIEQSRRGRGHPAEGCGQAASVVDALIEGGVTAMEVTMTVPGAVGLIEQLAKDLPSGFQLGAGTVLDPETARAGDSRWRDVPRVARC